MCWIDLGSARIRQNGRLRFREQPEFAKALEGTSLLVEIQVMRCYTDIIGKCKKSFAGELSAVCRAFVLGRRWRYARET